MDELLRNRLSRIFNQYEESDAIAVPDDAVSGKITRPDQDLILRKIPDAIARTQGYYFGQQHSDGYWWYELESNVTITAEYLMLLHFLGIDTREKDRKIANYILGKQRPDGTWAIHWGGRGDLSTTVEAYFALKLAGYTAEHPSLCKAREFILANGGVEASRVFTRIFLALFGEFNWRSIPSIPVEINLLPHWFPINIYNFSSWARTTIVPLSVLLDLRPVKPIPAEARIRELYREPDKLPHITVKKLPIFSLKHFFVVVDHVFKVWETFKLRPLRRLALKKTERWIREHQEPTGDWGGIQPAMVNSLLALFVRGYNVSHGTMKRGLKALEKFTIETDDELVLQSCISPVWDTALTALALEYSGVTRDHFSVVQASKWLAMRRQHQRALEQRQQPRQRLQIQAQRVGLWLHIHHRHIGRNARQQHVARDQQILAFAVQTHMLGCMPVAHHADPFMAADQQALAVQQAPVAGRYGGNHARVVAGAAADLCQRVGVGEAMAAKEGRGRFAAHAHGRAAGQAREVVVGGADPQPALPFFR